MAAPICIHVGGTNTGKTYESLNRLAQAESGVYLAPLRLLALEVQESIVERGVNCSMLTARGGGHPTGGNAHCIHGGKTRPASRV